MLIVITLIGAGGGLGAVLQARLMDVAGNGQNLAAALNHSAFNTANALGPWLGGMAITAGYGWTSTGAVGVVLALGGLAVWAISYRLDRRLKRTTSLALSHPTLALCLRARFRPTAVPPSIIAL